MQTGLQIAGDETRRNSGKHTFSGVVQDERGKPVAGACLRIGKEIIYSIDRGAWELRSGHNKSQTVTVLVDEFQLGAWQIMSAPVEAKPGDPSSS